jgi:RNA polymerase sigma factor (sigma-70 family)
MDSAEVTVLIHRAAEGDRAAWHAIVDEYAGLVWSVVRGFRLGDAQAADAVQTTWLRLIEHVSAIRDPERLPGWLRTTARRACLETIRGAGREHPVAEHWEDARPASNRPDADDGGPESCSIRKEQQRLVRAALAALPERHQALVRLLVASPPASYEEISEQLDMPIGSIGPTRARILARLREALAAQDLCDSALG